MGWFSQKEEPEYRLLDKRTPNGGIVFWVRDPKNAQDQTFIDKLLTSTAKHVPTDFLARMATADIGELLSKRTYPLPDGGCELHIEFVSPSSLEGADKGGYYQDPVSAAHAAYKVSTALLVMSDEEVQTQFSRGGEMQMKLMRGPSEKIESTLAKALAVILRTLNADKDVQFNGWKVYPANSKHVAFIDSVYSLKDGTTEELPMFLWRGDSSLLYLAVQNAVVEALGIS